MWKKIDLKDVTTLGLSGTAFVCSVTNEYELEEVLKSIDLENDEPFILGGGSNIVLGPEISGRKIIKMEIKGIKIIDSHGKDNNGIFVQIGAGEIWDDVVAWAVKNNYSGIEALSAIPGTAGATPVQNVGAYGAEIKDVLVSVRAYNKKTKQFIDITNSDCELGYRTSAFKTTKKGQYIITSIILKLSTNPPVVPSYAGVSKYFAEHGITNPSLQQIRDAIIEIRWSKLPKPSELANCGSFFENVVIEKSFFEKLKIDHPDMLGFETPEGKIKVPAGWLIENAGLKGKNFGPVGVYEKNAMVLVNRGGASFEDIIHARDEVIKTVFNKFGITLETEPEFVC